MVKLSKKRVAPAPAGDDGGSGNETSKKTNRRQKGDPLTENIRSNMIEIILNQREQHLREHNIKRCKMNWLKDLLKRVNSTTVGINITKDDITNEVKKRAAQKKKTEEAEEATTVSPPVAAPALTVINEVEVVDEGMAESPNSDADPAPNLKTPTAVLSEDDSNESNREISSDDDSNSNNSPRCHVVVPGQTAHINNGYRQVL